MSTNKNPADQFTISVLQTYPSRQIHCGSVQSLHHRHTLLQVPSTPLLHCSACEGLCLPVLYCGGHISRSRAPKQLAQPLRESPGRTPSRGWSLGSGGRRSRHPWGKHKLHCRLLPGQICNEGKMLKMVECKTFGSEGTISKTWMSPTVTHCAWEGQSCVSSCWFGCICWVGTGEVNWAPPLRNSYLQLLCQSSPSPPWSPSLHWTAGKRKG